MSLSEVSTVLAWHEALASGNVEALTELSSADVVVGSTSTFTQGVNALLEWATTAPALVVGEVYVHDGVVVARENDSTAAAFRVVHDAVTTVVLHDSLEGAFAATGVELKDLFDD